MNRDACPLAIGRLFGTAANIAIYIRVNSTYESKVSCVFKGLEPRIPVTFDQLMHFDFTADTQKHDAYYFLRIAILAYDIHDPQVRY